MRLVPVTSLNGVTALTRVTTTGTLTSGSAVVTAIAATSAIQGAVGVTGTGIPPNTYVYSIDSATQITLGSNATATGAQTLTFTLEPITLAEAKAHARIEFPDDDALVAGLITAARRYAETALREALLTQQWILYLDSFPSAGGYYNRAIREIWPSLGGLPSGLGFYPGLIPNSTGVIDIPLPPLISIDSVKYYDFAGVLQTVNASTYNTSLGVQGRIQPQYSTVWPISRPTIDSVQVTFTAGYGATAAVIPDNVKAAIKMYISHLYENREAVQQGQFMVVPMAVDSLLGASDPGIYA
jgi:hypothetical protein